MRQHVAEIAARPKRLSQIYLRTRRGKVVIGDVLYTPGGSCGPRIQRNYQLVIVYRGSVRLELNDEIYEVSANHGILLSPGYREHFLFAADHETRHSWIAVSPAALHGRMRHEFEKYRGPLLIHGKMVTLLEMLRAKCISQHKNVVLESGSILGLAVALMCEFASAAASGNHAPNTGETILSHFDQYLSTAYTQPISLNDMARGTGVSRQHLMKVCREAGRSTPMQQLYRKRLEVAAELLSHTGFPLSQIAELCGFSNAFHFSRKYKEFCGESPLSWRRKQWKSDVPEDGKAIHND